MNIPLVALGVLIVAVLVEAGHAQQLTRYRLDIEPGAWFWQGRSWAFQRNLYRRENYTEEGQRKLWRLAALRLVQVAAGVTLVLSLVLGSGPTLLG